MNDMSEILGEANRAFLGEHWLPGAQGIETLERALQSSSSTRAAIAEIVVAVGCLLLAKNAAYDNSALQPVECFARGITPKQRRGVRMDDKLSRLMRGDDSAGGERGVVDLAGYLLLDLAADHLDGGVL